MGITTFLIFWFLPTILIFLLIRKHNEIVKKHELKDYELITVSTFHFLTYFFFFVPFLNIVHYIYFLFGFFSKDGTGKYVKFFKIKSINGKTFSIKKFLNKLLNA